MRVFDRKSFEEAKAKAALSMGQDAQLKNRALSNLADAVEYRYAHQFTWMGAPVIQLPQDLFVTQELLVKTKPDIVIETGIAWGGSVLFHASVLQLLGNGILIAIDKTIPKEIKSEISNHPWSDRIILIEGDSAHADTLAKVKSQIKNGSKVSVFLDSNHEHTHVMAELNAYGPLVTHGQYLTVYATSIEFLPEPQAQTRPWGHGNNPFTAVRDYLKYSDRFEIDSKIDDKLLGSFAMHGRLLCKADS